MASDSNFFVITSAHPQGKKNEDLRKGKNKEGRKKGRKLHQSRGKRPENGIFWGVNHKINFTEVCYRGL